MKKLRRHQNILYSLVVLLLVTQIIVLLVFTTQISRLTIELDQKIEKANRNLSANLNNRLEEQDIFYQQNFNEISQAIAQQIAKQESFEQEIKLLQSSQEDFSGIVDDAVKSVVTVATPTSRGTGFFVNSSGYIVTNYHVISNGGRIEILTYDRKEITAQLIGFDTFRDLALLKVSGDFKEFELADSDKLQVGRKVIAIGNPLGLSFTVTEGIISALDREGPNGLDEYIQTDVSLNPGNSGGPLIDTTGKVVGINNFKIGGAESLGFALESNSIKQTINKITNNIVIS